MPIGATVTGRAGAFVTRVLVICPTGGRYAGTGSFSALAQAMPTLNAGVIAALLGPADRGLPA